MSQDPTHRRSATRAPVGRPIKLQFDDSMDVIEGMCRNVSIGGMFIVFESSRPAGSLVRFELELDEDNAIRGLGEVVWMRSKSEFGGPEAGFGLKFRFLEQRDRQMIFKLVSRHIKDRLANREPAGGEPAEEPGAPAADLAAPPADRLPPSIAVPPDPVPAAGPAEPPGSLFVPPESDLLSPEAPEPERRAPEPPPPPASRPGDSEVPQPAAPADEADLEPPALSPEDPFDFDLEPEPSFVEPVASDAEEILDVPADFDLPEPAGREPLAFDAEGFLSGDASPEDGPPPAASTREAIDLDPSVGDTPLYELGLDPEPSNAPAPEPEASFGTPTPPPVNLPGGSYLAREPEAEEDVARPESVYMASSRRPRRDFSIVPVLGVLLLTAAAVGYLFKDELLARFGGGPPPVEARAAPPRAPEAEAVEPGGEAAPQPAEEAPPTAAAVAASGAASPATTPAPPEPAPRPAAAPPPTPVAAPSPPPTPAPVQAAEPAAAAAGAFTRLLDISWEEVAGGLRVTLTADGTIPNGRYRYFHLGGDAPREVVKLTGVSQSFRQNQLTVGGPGVRRIRTGFHRLPGGNEQHVVIDLLGPRWTITEVESVGSTLRLTIAEE